MKPLDEGHGFSRAVNALAMDGFIDACTNNVRVSLFLANFKTRFVERHDFVVP
jgi:hypothetical protein